MNIMTSKMWLKIKVLLWKSWCLRKRYWIGSILEITIPMLLFFFLIIVKSNISGTFDSETIIQNQSIPNPVTEENLFTEFKKRYSESDFLYTPNTTQAKIIIDNVVSMLEIEPDKVRPVSNESEIVNFLKNFFKSHYSDYKEGFGIVFEKINSTSFSYKIRLPKESFNTDLLFPNFQVPGPMDSGEPYLKTGFLALQLALDKSFIHFSNKSANSIDSHNFSIQSYPYAQFAADSDFENMFQIMLPLFTVISFLLMCSNTIKRVVEEKESGVKELMKMMGLKPWMIWTGWMLHNLFAYSISITTIVWLVCVKQDPSGGKILNHTDPVLFWIFLFLYTITGIFFCFAISGFFSKPIFATNAGLFLWMISFSIPHNIIKPNTNYKIKLIFMLLPNVALSNGYTSIASLETQGNGLQFSTLFTSGSNTYFSVGFIFFIFILDCILYGFLAWYLDSVKPGKYGIAKPINFLCNWFKEKSETNIMEPINNSTSKLFEKAPSDYEIGISIQNLYKSFGSCQAVNGVNLDIYKGQITALLGHNGAGKTTTMSIITGMFSPTHGCVKIKDGDIYNNLDKFRENLGLCPQHNLLFNYLSTLDHLIFFGMLKGLSFSVAKTEGINLLTLLNILPKKDELVSNLSGGMKRKLSLSIALIGDPEVLILDEPTSGMDPESRREMWDLLLSIRGKRTILITTHFMEEADVLGDRIAIMDHGKVICYGTSLFLKKAYGTGYNLTIIKKESFDVIEMAKVIKDFVPEANLQSSLSAQVVFNLPNESSNQFPELFRMLELKKEEFGISGIGISCTTMEEVFLRSGGNAQENENNSPVHTPTGYNDYQLIINKHDNCNVDHITAFLEQYIPEYSLMDDLSNQVVFNLPSSNRSQFSSLFSALDFQKKNLKIESIKISHSIFGVIYPNSNGVGDDIDEQKEGFNGDVTQTLMPKYVSGITLLKNQIVVLLSKKILYSLRRWFLTLIFGILPLLIAYLTLNSSYDLFKASSPPKKLHLALDAYEDSDVYYHVGENSTNKLESRFASISTMYHATVTELSSDQNLVNYLLELCSMDVFKYRSKVMIAGDFNETQTTVIYNNIAYHTPGIAVNMFTNALLQKLSGNNESSISVINEPIQNEDKSICGSNFVLQLTIIWLTMFSSGVLYFICYFIALPLNERVSGIKHLQIMSKLSPITYWISCFIWDYICYFIVIITTMVVIYLFDEYHIFSGKNELGALFIIFIAYGWSSIFYAYSFSFFKKTLISSISLFIAINLILGMIVNSMLLVAKLTGLSETHDSSFSFWYNIIRYVILLVPHFSYTACIVGFVSISWSNNMCKLCKTPDAHEACSGSDSKMKQYFEFASKHNSYAILEELLFLIFSSLIYIAFILLMDYKVFSTCYQFIFNKIVGSGESYKDDNEDPDVGGERDKVDAAKARVYNATSPILVVDNLVKKFNLKFTGVRGISFTVAPGECFGLLGVNGAGKTTTFRILTGDIFPSKGDAYIQTDEIFKLSSSFGKYISMIGYCPQFDAINDQLTAEETLRLMAILRGISTNNASKHVNKWIKLLGLEEYKNKQSGTYSGGNKRKLNTAMALIGDPPVVFLDEPTSGVDPIARRNLWQLLAVSQKAGQAVILTSHSMDECEALCNRLTIMVDGVMKCIGSIQYLKNRYGQGFTIMIKLIHNGNQDLTALKEDIMRQFAPDIYLKDEHKGLLHYHITNPRVPLSDIFGHMKAIKENHSIVEDYTISDTTLEQVFIAFAKKQAILNTNL
ncbi:phospholipid-transporting ATPase ABCA3-like isoform X2 [Daktulosphaira vitifoliae]|uniref:phospholipid-transporting ATPase ABCA3-like isoform X2 n=1 Tax=Daktulosphaira vitifoliae TaxID=58002 RepID=UPI0021AA1739|nr:phospholipid-transporting ATPase ABCA3-like isoform X2 [Daktulosphaira vitifoliae]